MIKAPETDDPSGFASSRIEPLAAHSRSKESVEISVRGKKVKVPYVKIQNRMVIVTGTWLKIASVFDEEVIDGDVIPDPESFLHQSSRARSVARISLPSPSGSPIRSRSTPTHSSGTTKLCLRSPPTKSGSPSAWART